MQIYIEFNKKYTNLLTRTFLHERKELILFYIVIVLNFVKFYEKYTKFHKYVYKCTFQLQIY